MADEGLDAAEALCKREHFRLRRERARALRAAAQYERYHAAEAAHLPLRKLVLRRAWQSGIVQKIDVIVAVEKRDESARVVFVLAHPYRERLRAAQHEEAVERARHA